MEEKNVNEKNIDVLDETENVNEQEKDVSETETLEIVSEILADNEQQEDAAQVEITESEPMSEFEKDRAKLQEINSRIPKKEPILKTIGRNLKEKISNILAIIYSSIAGVISLLGFLFFTSQKSNALDKETISSCEIMQVFFGLILGLCIIILIISIIMNIIRVKKNKE